MSDLPAIVGGWLYGAESLRRYMNEVSEWHIGKWWNFSIRWMIPIVLVMLFVTQFSTDLKTPYEGYPTWALSIGWATVLLPFSLFILMFVTNKKPKQEAEIGNIRN